MVRKVENIVYVIVFGVLFLAPIAFFLTDHKEESSVEKRALAKAPSLAWDSLALYPQQATKYWNDHFPHRIDFYNQYAFFKIKYLHTSPKPDHAICGKSGWLFYTMEKVLLDYQAKNLLNAGQVSHVEANLGKWNNWLKEQGIAFYLVVAPNKHTVYSEYLPNWIPERDGTITRLDQIKGVVKKLNIPFIDLRSVMLQQKKQHRIYHKTDTHWNDLGAYYGYCEIIKRIQKDFPLTDPLRLEEYHITDTLDKGGDLANMLGTQDYLKEHKPQFTPLIPNPAFNQPGKPYSDFHNPQVAENFTAFVFHDSYGKYLKPFLSRHFHKTQFLWDHHFNYEYIQKEKPKVVIHVVVERYVDMLLWQ